MDSVAGGIRGIVYHSRQWPHEFKGHDGGEDDEDLYRCNLITSMGYDGRCPPKGFAGALCLPTQAGAPAVATPAGTNNGRATVGRRIWCVTVGLDPRVLSGPGRACMVRVMQQFWQGGGD